VDTACGPNANLNLLQTSARASAGASTVWLQLAENTT